jgi:hypothetical protein
MNDHSKENPLAQTAATPSPLAATVNDDRDSIAEGQVVALTAMVCPPLALLLMSDLDFDDW